jgi:hypothetical protein
MANIRSCLYYIRLDSAENKSVPAATFFLAGGLAAADGTALLSRSKSNGSTAAAAETEAAVAFFFVAVTGAGA